MSEHGFHVHGPHDHEVEHVAQHGGDAFTSRLAVLTAVLSTIGAIFGYLGGHSQNAALIYKNEAAIQKTSASNQWNYYQAKSNKQNLSELSIVLTSGETQEKYRQEVARYKGEKEEIKSAAAGCSSASSARPAWASSPASWATSTSRVCSHSTDGHARPGPGCSARRRSPNRSAAPGTGPGRSFSPCRDSRVFSHSAGGSVRRMRTHPSANRARV